MQDIPSIRLPGALLAALVLLGLALGAGTASAEPSVGEPAPDFAFEETDGTVHLLSEHRGKRGIVIAWFPKAFTPG